MSLFDAVRFGVGRKSGTVIRECRHCGLTFETRETVCPSCDRAEIAEYTIP